MTKKNKENIMLVGLKYYFKQMTILFQSLGSFFDILKKLFNKNNRAYESRFIYWNNLKDGFRNIKLRNNKIAATRFKIANWQYRKIYKKDCFVCVYQVAKIKYILGKYKDSVKYLKLAADSSSNQNNLKLIEKMYSRLENVKK